MIVSAIIGLIFVVGGITLYRTFALYEEKKEFNVLRGKIPNFGNYDISMIAIIIDGQNSTTIPELGNYAVNVDCKNGTGYWDYEKWSAVITSINNQTKCNLNFKTTTESIEWREWIQKGKITNYYETLHDFLSETESVTQVLNSKEASTFLKENTNIINNIKNDKNYLSDTLSERGENKDSRSELVIAILNSTGLTNKEKYDLKLPYHIFKNGDSFLKFTNSFSRLFENNPVPQYSANYGTNIYLSLKNSPNDCATNKYVSTQNINVDGYSAMSIRYTGSTSNHHSWNVGYTTGTSMEVGITSIYVANTGWYSKKLANFTGNKSAIINTGACSNGDVGEAKINLYEWYMY